MPGCGGSSRRHVERRLGSYRITREFVTATLNPTYQKIEEHGPYDFLIRHWGLLEGFPKGQMLGRACDTGLRPFVVEARPLMPYPMPKDYRGEARVLLEVAKASVDFRP